MSSAELSSSGTTSKLQFAERSGTCDTAFSGESYADVASGSGAIRFYNNTTPADGDNLATSTNDPMSGSNPVIKQDYEEANNFTNSVATIPSGSSGLWDFALVDNSAPAGTTYCFRAVQSGGGTLDTYTVIPEITTAQNLHTRVRGTVRLRVVRFI